MVGRLDGTERQVVVGLLEQARDFVAPTRPSTGDPLEDLVAGLGDDTGGEHGPASPGDQGQPAFRDPALERLLPPAHRTDAGQAAEFRRLTEHGLRGRKVATLETAIAALQQADPPRVELDEGQAEALAVGLTDVRLILGERLGLRTDQDADRIAEEAARSGDADDPQLAMIAYYDFLTWLQESITQALMRH